jgi:fatty-acid desaturase
MGFTEFQDSVAQCCSLIHVTMDDMKDKSIHFTAQKLTEEIQNMPVYKKFYSQIQVSLIFSIIIIIIIIIIIVIVVVVVVVVVVISKIIFC